MSQPNQVPARKAIQGTRKPKGRRNFVVLLVICALLVGGYFGFKHIKHDRAIAMQHKQYQAAGLELNKLADKIVSVYGKPSDRKTNNYCTSVKSSKSIEQPYCVTSLAIVYGMADKSAAIQLASQAQALTHQDSDIFQIASHQGDPELAGAAISASPNLSFRIKGSKDLTCETNSFYTPLDDPAETHVVSHELMLTFSCGVKPSLSTYYSHAD